MIEAKSVMNFAELLAATASDGKMTRIERVALPRDQALCDRFALVFAGPHAAELLVMVTEALDNFFSQGIAAQPQPVESHGPDSSTQRPD